MKCPACGTEMTEVQVQDIAVDVCRGGCGGIWFDWMELKKVDEPHEALGEELLQIERNESLEVDHATRRMCPHCSDVVMMRHFASVKREVEVDECPQCAGFFLDYGELHHLRDQFDTEEERRDAAQDYFANLYDSCLTDHQAESQERVEKARGFARMFRFLLPSYYMRGKQPWGAY